MMGTSEAGKGSDRRKPLVSQDQVDRNYEAFQRSMAEERKKKAKEAEEAKHKHCDLHMHWYLRGGTCKYCQR